MAHSRKRALLAVVALVAAFSARPVAAELAAWDQTRVTEVAQQLAEACDAWSLALREQPAGRFASGEGPDEFGLVQNARLLQEMSGALAADLAKGKGHDDTRNRFRSLKEVVDDAEVQARQAELDEPTLDAWAQIADLMRQIAPYYDPRAQGEPEQGSGE